MSEIETIELAQDLPICRILNGMWQVAGGHGQINHDSAISQMLQYNETGFNTWDMADIYGPAESFYGDFRKTLEKKKGKEELEKIQGLTKFVPNPGPMTRSIVEHYIEQSMKKNTSWQPDLYHCSKAVTDDIASNCREIVTCLWWQDNERWLD